MLFESQESLESSILNQSKLTAITGYGLPDYIVQTLNKAITDYSNKEVIIDQLKCRETLMAAMPAKLFP